MVWGWSALDVKARDEAAVYRGGAESGGVASQPCGDLPVLFKESEVWVCGRAGLAELVLVEIKE